MLPIFLDFFQDLVTTFQHCRDLISAEKPLEESFQRLLFEFFEIFQKGTWKAGALRNETLGKFPRSAESTRVIDEMELPIPGCN